MDKSPKRFKDLDLNAVDERVRGIVITMNQFPFLETTQSCSGHPHYSDSKSTFQRSLYTPGFIHGAKRGEEFPRFIDSLEEFMSRHNPGNETRFRLPWAGRGTGIGTGTFWLTLSPGLEVEYNHFTGEPYVDVRNDRELRIIDRQMASSWEQFHAFLKNYNSN